MESKTSSRTTLKSPGGESISRRLGAEWRGRTGPDDGLLLVELSNPGLKVVVPFLANAGKRPSV